MVRGERMKIFVFERCDWVPYRFDLVYAEDEQEARSFLDKKHILLDVYEIEKGIIGEVFGG
jgi:hypothetical protein